MNAKKEFIGHTFNKSVKCAMITFGGYDDSVRYTLPCAWNKEEYDTFLKSIDREYDDGYGGQELFGTIWYTDGTWSSRWEYDGSEGWEYNHVPTIPEDMERKDLVRDLKIEDIVK